MDEQEPKGDEQREETDDKGTSGSAWDALVADLGVTPSADALERKETPPAPPASPGKSSSPPPAAKPSDWNALAAELGVDPGEAPPAEPAATTTEPPTPAEASHQADPGDIAEQDEVTEEAEQATSAWTADRDRALATSDLLDAEATEPELKATSPASGDVRGSSLEEEEDDDDFPLDVEEAEAAIVDDEPEVAEADGEVDGETASEAEPAETTPSKPVLSGEAARSAFDALFAAGSSLFLGDRRKKKEAAPPAADATQEETPASAGAEPDNPLAEMFPPTSTPKQEESRVGRRRVDSEPDDDDLATEAIETEESEESDDEHAERPRRRRRRRRGRRRGKGSDELAASDLSDEAAPAEATGDLEAPDDELTDEDDSEEEATQQREAKSGGRRRTSHRNIPSWSDAICLIVDTNLASRKENPTRQGNSRKRGGRSRGGRGRGRKSS